jgi:NAD(P)-dependent dehydrogenase (short-subunit alcohol dehydrogenase family)
VGRAIALALARQGVNLSWEGIRGAGQMAAALSNSSSKVQLDLTNEDSLRRFSAP